jgi:hypothetical protein
MPMPGQEAVMVCHPTEPRPDAEVCEFDELAHQFTQQFYSTLNQHHADRLATHFWHNSTMQFVLTNKLSLYTADMACDVDNVVKLLGNVKALYNIDFKPNLLPGGVTVKTQDQGFSHGCGNWHNTSPRHTWWRISTVVCFHKGSTGW